MRGLVAVDAEGERLTHGLVVEGRLRGVEPEVDVVDGREPVVVVGPILAHVVGVDARDVLAAPLSLTRGQELVGWVVVGEGRVVDGLDNVVRREVRYGAGVAGVGDVLRRALPERERASADRVRNALTDRVLEGGPDVLRHDADLVCDRKEVRHRRVGEGHDDLVSA